MRKSDVCWPDFHAMGWVDKEREEFDDRDD